MAKSTLKEKLHAWFIGDDRALETKFSENETGITTLAQLGVCVSAYYAPEIADAFNCTLPISANIGLKIASVTGAIDIFTKTLGKGSLGYVSKEAVIDIYNNIKDIIIY